MVPYGMKVLVIAALMAMMFVLPASADLKTVPAGGTVFIGEEDIDISQAVGTASCVLEYYTSGQTLGEVPYATRTVSDPAHFSVLTGDYAGKTGTWYLHGNNACYIRVEEPRINVHVRNEYDNDVTGKAVVRGDSANFRIETNLYEIYYRDTTATFPFSLKVESPGGVVYTSLFVDNTNVKSLTNLPVDNGLWVWSGYAPVGYWDTASKDGAGNYRYIAGEYKVSAECNANKLKDNNEKAKTTPVKVTIASDTLDLSINKESVIRGGQFVISVKGTPSVTYNLYVKSVGTTIAPKVISSQEGVVKTSEYSADVTTNSAGERSVGFATDKDTKAKKWTIRIEEISGDRYDEVTIDVQEGALSVSTEGSGVYYLGEEIKVIGTNTETDTTYFFITGPNLPSAGGSLTDPRVSPEFVSANVKDDDSYEYKWNTESLSIDSGSYTVYAVSSPVNKDNLTAAQYDTVSVSFRKPYVNVLISPTNVAAGDKIHITGDAGVETTTGIAIWIMGKNYFVRDVVSVESDGTYDYELKSGDTENLASGQYFVVAQHPMYDAWFDVDVGEDLTPNGTDNRDYVVGSYPVKDSRKFKYAGAGALQGSDAATALVDAIDDAAIDDTYARSQFMVSQASISIKPVNTVTIGNTFVIEGITNLAVGNDVLVEVVSSSFGPTKKTASGEFSGFSGTAEVVSGDSGWNKFSIEASSATFIEDEYIITASAITVPVTGSITFDVIAFVPTTVPTTKPTTVPTTVVPTTVPTTEVTTIPTTEVPTATPTKSPGFGAVIALVGLVLTGYLVVRDHSHE